MATLTEQIEKMRARLNELATGENAIIRTLGEALSAVDQRLLDDVRQVSAAHEMRRGEILQELKRLADRMGALHSPHAPALDNAPSMKRVAPFQQHALHAPALEDAQSMEAQQWAVPLQQHALNGGGDWRQAAANVREELDKHFEGQTGISLVGH